MKFLSVFLLATFMCLITAPLYAQSVPPGGTVPVITAPIVSTTTALTVSGGLVKWVADHGGPQAAILFLIFSAFTMLSALRTVLYKYDGVNPGDPIPEDKTALTFVNKMCLFFGSILDFMTGNTKH